MENLVYALVQVVHNFGAAGVVGGAVFALWPATHAPGSLRRLAWVVLVAWAAQIVSGVGFGLTSLYYYGLLPDIRGVAVIALVVKILAAVLGLIIIAVYLGRSRGWSEIQRLRLWHVSAWLGVIALTAAAFLRWFS